MWVTTIIIASTAAAASAAAASSTNTNGQQQHQRQSTGGESLHATMEAARYSTLPPTVFAPGGRLHGVERVAKEALLVLDGDDEGEISCGVFALHCRRGRRRGNGDREQKDGNEEEEDDGEEAEEREFAVMVGIGATSPYLHRDEFFSSDQQQSIIESQQTINDENILGETTTYLPLEIDESASSSIITNNAPIFILSPTLLAGAGGKSVDSTILLRRATEVALSMYATDNGGVDWFVSHSLEGTDDGGGTMGNDGDGGADNNNGSRIVGGAAGADVSSLARRVADMAQSSTQSLGGKYGRMLSSSLIAMGARNPMRAFIVNENERTHYNNPDTDRLIMWRVDPTGQFWRMDASAVGRGSVNAEAEFLQRVRNWKMKQSTISEQQPSSYGSDDESECEIYHEDVRGYLGSLSERQAVELAIDCLVDGIMKSRKQRSFARDAKITGQIERGLRKRVQAVVIRSSDVGTSMSCIETV